MVLVANRAISRNVLSLTYLVGAWMSEACMQRRPRPRPHSRDWRMIKALLFQKRGQLGHERESVLSLSLRACHPS